MANTDSRGNLRAITFRAGHGRPCPCCGVETKGCSATDDGLSLCRGEPRDGWRQIGREDDAGFRHYRCGAGLEARPRAALAKPRAETDWVAKAGPYAAQLTPAVRTRLAEHLGLPVAALDAVERLGHDPGRGGSWILPEWDGNGRVVGLHRRTFRGKKYMVAGGGNRGLAIPVGWRDKPGPLLLVEGWSDALTLTHCGLAAIGRPSNVGGVAHLQVLLRSFPADREIVVVGEHDEKPDGSCPGRYGAQRSAVSLSRQLRRPINWAMTPDEAKDARAWVRNRLAELGEADHDWESLGREFVASLQPVTVTECGTSGCGPDANEEEQPGGKKEKPPSAASVLVNIVREQCDLWHDADGAAYATLNGLSHPVRGRAFKAWLRAAYYAATRQPISGEAESTAVGTAEGLAVHEGPCHPVYVRVAEHEGVVYVHLADRGNTVVAITADGWDYCPTPPVRFRRPAGMHPLPRPSRRGRLDALREYLNLADDQSWALVRAWLANCYRLNGPFPVLNDLGEQGSAKSTSGRVLKRLVDPTSANVRSEPRDARDLMIAAKNSWLLAYDNLSVVPPWFSDALCRLATGGGFSTRALYSDDEEVIFEAKRPVAVNGIEDLATRGDLLERSLIIRHPPIPPDRRVPEEVFWARFTAAHAGILGGLFDYVAGGLRERRNVRLATLPRMSDFAVFSVACELGQGRDGTAFLEAYAENQAAAHAQALEASVLTPAIQQFMAGRESWIGGATALLCELERFAPVPKPREWPRGANVLSNRLRRLAPDLRRGVGLDVQTGVKDGTVQNNRNVVITRVTPVPLLPAQTHVVEPSEPSETTGAHGNQAITSRGVTVREPSDLPAASSETRGTVRRPSDARPSRTPTIPGLFDTLEGSDGSDDGRPLLGAGVEEGEI